MKNVRYFSVIPLEGIYWIWRGHLRLQSSADGNFLTVLYAHVSLLYNVVNSTEAGSSSCRALYRCSGI